MFELSSGSAMDGHSGKNGWRWCWQEFVAVRQSINSVRNWKLCLVLNTFSKTLGSNSIHVGNGIRGG
jgi:hypothetical protein